MQGSKISLPNVKITSIFGLRNATVKCLGCRLIKFTYNRPPSHTNMNGSILVPNVGNMIPMKIETMAESKTTILPKLPLPIGERSADSSFPPCIVNSTW